MRHRAIVRARPHAQRMLRAAEPQTTVGSHSPSAPTQQQARQPLQLNLLALVQLNYSPHASIFGVYSDRHAGQKFKASDASLDRSQVSCTAANVDSRRRRKKRRRRRSLFAIVAPAQTGRLMVTSDTGRESARQLVYQPPRNRRSQRALAVGLLLITACGCAKCELTPRHTGALRPKCHPGGSAGGKSFGCYSLGPDASWRTCGKTGYEASAPLARAQTPHGHKRPAHAAHARDGGGQASACEEFKLEHCSPSKISRTSPLFAAIAADSSSVERGRLCRQNEELRSTIQDMKEAMQRQSELMVLRPKESREEWANNSLAAEAGMRQNEADLLRAQLQRHFQALGSAGSQLRRLTLERDKYKEKSAHATRLAIGGWIACHVVIQEVEKASISTTSDLNDFSKRFESALQTAMCVSLSVFTCISVLRELGGTGAGVDKRLLREIDDLKAEADSHTRIAKDLQAKNSRLTAEREALLSEVGTHACSHTYSHSHTNMNRERARVHTSIVGRTCFVHTCL